MAKPSALHYGDRIAYAAKFLKNTGQFTGSGPQRRGTFLTYDRAPMARVRWDDFEEYVAYYVEQYGADYVDDARQHGQLVHSHNIAKVGSPRFALNDM